MGYSYYLGSTLLTTITLDYYLNSDGGRFDLETTLSAISSTQSVITSKVINTNYDSTEIRERILFELNKIHGTGDYLIVKIEYNSSGTNPEWYIYHATIEMLEEA